ncbi:MAG: adenylate kinase [Thermoplasmata archaeon]
MRVVVTGVPGVGKSTVLNMASRKMGYGIINFGDVMMELANELGIKNRDEIRKLPVEKQREIQKLAAERIGKMENVFIDTHLSIKTPSGYLPGLPEWVLRAINPSMIVIIEVDPDIIIKRRERDNSRYRDEDSPEMLLEHQNINRAFGASCSVFTGAPLVIIKNEEGMAEKASEILMEKIGYGKH